MTIAIGLTVAFIFIILGAFFRRWWGGWENPIHILKIFVGFGLATLAGLASFKLATAALVFGGIVGASFLNPWHSKFMVMGNGGPPSLSACLIGYALSYGIPTAIAGSLIFVLFGEWTALAYIPVGGLIGPAYAFTWWLWNKVIGKDSTGAFKKFWQTGSLTINGVVTPQWFIDGPTSAGECLLGALLIGSMPLLSVVL